MTVHTGSHTPEKGNVWKRIISSSIQLYGCSQTQPISWEHHPKLCHAASIQPLTNCSFPAALSLLQQPQLHPCRSYARIGTLEHTSIMHHRLMPFTLPVFRQLSSTPFAQKTLFSATQTQSQVSRSAMTFSLLQHELNAQRCTLPFCCRRSSGKGRNRICSAFPQQTEIYQK